MTCSKQVHFSLLNVLVNGLLSTHTTISGQAIIIPDLILVVSKEGMCIPVCMQNSSLAYRGEIEPLFIYVAI